MNKQQPTTPPDSVYLTAREAAQRIGVSESYIERMCRQGRIVGAFKLGYVWAIPPQSLADFDSSRK